MAVAGDVRVAVISGPISPDGTGSADFTKPGLGTPKAAIIIQTRADATDAVVDGTRTSIGFTDFTNHRCITDQTEHASAKEDCDSGKWNTKCYVGLDVAGAVEIEGTAEAITDGVRLTNVTNSAAPGVDAPYTTVVAFAGDDLGVSMDTIASPNSVGGTAQVTTGIDQDLVFFIGSDTSAEDGKSSGVNNSFGVAHISKDHGTLSNHCIGWAIDHNASVGAPASAIQNNRVLSICTEAGGQDWAYELTLADATSFTVTERDNSTGAGMEIYSLALSFGDLEAAVGSIDGPTTEGDWVKTGLGFKPQYVGLLLTDNADENIIALDDTEAGVMGVSNNAGPGQNSCFSWYDEDGSAAVDAASIAATNVIELVDDQQVTTLQSHNHKSFNADGWTYDAVAVNETTAKKWVFIAIETNEKANEPLTELSGGILGLQNSYAGPFDI